jgi:hypothetical protein
MPLKRTGQNSIQTPLQFVTYPIAPVKKGTVIRLIVWLSRCSPPLPPASISFVGKRARKRAKHGEPVATVDYTDADGNVLTVRERVSAGTVSKLREPAGGAAASADDLWRRRTELLFERFAVSWTIAGLPLTTQKELLGRYRMADQTTQEWVRQTLDDHLRTHQPELA